VGSLTFELTGPDGGGPDGADAVDAAITALRAGGVDVTEEPGEEG
jgi:hypothetical protein